MTAIYLTIDTEYCSAWAQGPHPLPQAENFRRAIAGDVEGGQAGIFHQMEVMERRGCTGVFFVDPLPALVWGTQAIADVVGPIVDRGHDVQLHCHTEWLAIAGEANPLGGRTGRNMADFMLTEQVAILEMARDTLVAAGAPPPVAFRAGNYARTTTRCARSPHWGSPTIPAMLRESRDRHAASGSEPSIAARCSG